MTVALNNGYHLEAEDPVIVALSEPGETRWGRHQFASCRPYPGGRLLVRYHDADDAIAAYGTPEPAYVSDDGGRSWEPLQDETLPDSGPPCPVLDGGFLITPPSKPLLVENPGDVLPAPVSGDSAQHRYSFHRVSDCPPHIQDYVRTVPAARWDPQSERWQPDTVRFDPEDEGRALLWTRPLKDGTVYVSASWVEHMPVRVDGDLLYAAYRQNYILPDGSEPVALCSSCMASADNGRSFSRRGHVAAPEGPLDLMGEPMLAAAPNGDLVCVIRQQVGSKRLFPMLIARSTDRGATWTQPAELFEFGVLPQVLTLGNGAMVCSFGRPGVHLMLSTDGAGRTWSPPQEVLAGDRDAIMTVTDGYTEVAPVDDDTFVLAYSHFDHVDDAGQQRKAILTQRFRVWKR
jgi:hypothetical protein